MKYVFNQICAGLVLALYCSDFVVAADFSKAIMAGKERLEYYLERSESKRDSESWLERATQAENAAMAEWEICSLVLKESNSDIYDEEKVKASNYFNSLVQERYADFIKNRDRAELFTASVMELKQQLYDLTDSLEGDWETNARQLFDSYVMESIEENDPQFIEQLSLEYEELSRLEENRYLQKVLYDHDSLKAHSMDSSASSIAGTISNNILVETSAEFKELLSQLDVSIDADNVAIETFTDEDWYRRFSEEMDRVSSVWKEAEEEFLMARSLWQEQAEIEYDSFLEKWQEGYDSLLQQKASWENSIYEKILKTYEDGEYSKTSFALEIESMVKDYRQNLELQLSGIQQSYELARDVYGETRSLLSQCRTGIETWNRQWGEKYGSVYEYALDNGLCGVSPIVEKILKDEIDLNDIDQSYIEEFKNQISGFKTLAINYYMDQVENQQLEYESRLAVIEEKLTYERSKGINFGNTLIYSRKSRAIIENLEKEKEQVILEMDCFMDAIENLEDDFYDLESIDERIGLVEKNCGSLLEKDGYFSLSSVFFNCFDDVIYWMDKTVEYKEKEKETFHTFLEIATERNDPDVLTERDVEIEKARLYQKECEEEYAIAKVVYEYANAGKDRESASETEGRLRSVLCEYESAKEKYLADCKSAESAYVENIAAAEKNIKEALEKVEEAESRLKKLQDQYELDLTAFKSRKQEKGKLETFYNNSLEQLKNTIEDCALCEAFDFYNNALAESGDAREIFSETYDELYSLLFQKEDMDFNDFAKAVLEAQKIGACNVQAVEYVIKLICMETILGKESKNTTADGLKEVQEKMNLMESIGEEDDYEIQQQKSLEYLALTFENMYWELANEIFENQVCQWDSSNNYENIRNAIDMAFINMEDLFIPSEPGKEIVEKKYNQKVSGSNVESCLGKMNVYKIKLENLENGQLENEMDELLQKEREVSAEIVSLREEYYKKFTAIDDVEISYGKDVEKLNAQYEDLGYLFLEYRKALAVYDYAANIYLDSKSVDERLKKAEETYLGAEEKLRLLLNDPESKVSDAVKAKNLETVCEYEKDAYLASILLYETMEALEKEQDKLNKAKSSYESAFHDITESDDAEAIAWLMDIREDQQYFDALILASLYTAAINGELDDVHGVNKNPLSAENVVYVLTNVDSKDELNSKKKYLRFRKEQLEAAYERVKNSERGDRTNDIERCCKLRNENTLFAELLESMEKNLLNYRCYEDLRKNYKEIKEDHSFARGLFGDTFMDGTGRAGQASEAIIKQMKEQVNSLLTENKLMMDELFDNYLTKKEELADQNETYEKAVNLTAGTYEAAVKQVIELLGNSTRLSIDEISSIFKKYGEKSNVNVLDFVYGVYEFYACRYEKAKDDSIAGDVGEFYKKAITQDNRIDINSDMEWYLTNEMDLYIDSLLADIKKQNELKIEKYKSQLNNEASKSSSIYDKNVENLQKTLVIAREKWEKAESDFISVYNQWKKNCEIKKAELDDLWQENYESFLAERDEMLNESYIEQYVSAGMENLDSSYEDERITRLVESAKDLCKVQYSGDYYGRAIDSALELSFTKDLDDYLESHDLFNSSGWNVTKKTYVSNTTGTYAKKLVDSMDWVLEEQKNIASRTAASKAYEIAESLKQGGLEKISSENKYQKDYEMELVRNQGYSVDGNSILRTVARGATVFGLTYQTQSVHMYRNFSSAAVSYSSDFNYLDKLSENSINRIVAITFDEYRQWEENIFGTENGGGEFERYLGDVPELKKNVDIQNGKKENSFDYSIKGEKTLILMDLTWNSLKADEAYEEIALPVWDKKLVDASWAPTIRTTATIAAAVAGSIVSGGTASGAAAVMASAAISSGISMANELAFAALDYGYGYKSLDEIGASLGSSLISNGIGVLTAGASTAAGNISNISQRISTQVALNGAGTAAKTISSALIGSGGDWSTLNDLSLWSGALSAMTSTAVSSGLDQYNLGQNLSKVKGFSSINIDTIKSLDSFVAGIASTAVEYGITGETKINIARVKNTGVFEVGFSDDGLTGGLGTGGMDASLGSVIKAFEGGAAVAKNIQIMNFIDDNSIPAESLRMQYGFGNKDAKNQLNDILDGKTLIKDSEFEKAKAKSVFNDGIKTINVNDLDSIGAIELALVLQHEAERNGMDDGILGQVFETIDSVAEHTLMAMKLSADELYTQDVKNYLTENPGIAKEIGLVMESLSSKNLNEFANYALSNYDYSEDFWKLKSGGQLVNDGQGYLKNEDGLYINKDGSTSENIRSDTIGAKGIESGLLNILNDLSNEKYGSFTDSQILMAQKFMMDAGMVPDNANKNFKDYTWNNNSQGQKINMLNLMNSFGNSVADAVFESYYNNTADLDLANRIGVDLGFVPTKYVVENTVGRYKSLLEKKSSENMTAQELKDKYKFSYTDTGGNTIELFQLNENNPFLDKLLGQHDFKEENYKAIDEKGCNFMSIIAVPQLMTGNVFDKDEVLEIWNKSVEKGIVDSSDANVNDRNELLHSVFSKYAKRNFEIEIDNLKDKSSLNIGYRIGFINDNKKVYHYGLGTQYGNVIYNPGYSTSIDKEKTSIKMR